MAAAKNVPSAEDFSTDSIDLSKWWSDNIISTTRVSSMDYCIYSSFDTYTSISDLVDEL